MGSPSNNLNITQHLIVEYRSAQERFRLKLRRFGDCFVVHGAVLIICCIQVILCFMQGLQQYFKLSAPNSLKPISTALNITFLLYFIIDTVLLALLHFILSPSIYGPTQFKSSYCQCCSTYPNITTQKDFVRLSADENVFKRVKYINNSSNTNWRKNIEHNLWLTLKCNSKYILTMAQIILNLIGFTYGLFHFSTLYLVIFCITGYMVNYPRYFTSLRVLVSSNKRLLDDAQDVLDLTYITDRIIAMGFPSQRFESWYRNPIEDISSYLHSYYPKKHLVINACIERWYYKDYFHQCATYACNDHEVMPLYRLLTFCKLTEEFLKHDKDSVVAVHCVGGKGRTGLLITSWLLYSGLCSSPTEALRYFGERRTDPDLCGSLKTLNNICQIRFLWYFNHLCRQRIPDHKRLKLKRVIIRCRNPSKLLTTYFKKLSVTIDDPFPSPLLEHNDMAVQASCANSSSSLHYKYTDDQPEYGYSDFLRGKAAITSTNVGTSSILFGHNLKDMSRSIYFNWILPNSECVLIEGNEEFYNNIQPNDICSCWDKNEIAFVLPNNNQNKNENEEDIREEILLHQQNVQLDISEIENEFVINLNFKSTLIGRIWLHTDFLDIGLPPEQHLNELHSCKPQDNLKTPSIGRNILWIDKTKHSRFIVGFDVHDIDFNNQIFKSMFKKTDFCMICMFVKD